MSAQVCLRCDWSGEGGSTVCPACGEPLYVTRPGIERTPGAGSTDHGAEGSDLAHAEVVPEPVSPTQFRRAAVAVLAVLIVSAAAFIWVRRGHQVLRPQVGPHLTGTLVYAVGGVHGSARLWRWDLASDTVRPGPRVRDPVELVNADRAQPGWVGLTSRLGSGRFEGSVLRSLKPSDRATPLVSGSLVSWAEHAIAGVVSLRQGPATGCYRRVTIAARRLLPSAGSVSFERRICGDVTSVGRAADRTFLTIARASDAKIVFADSRGLHPVLDHSRLLGVSATGDLLTIAVSRPTRPGGAQHPGLGTALVLGGQSEPIAYGSGDAVMLVDRVLSWSPDSSVVLVQGTLGPVSGLFELGARPGDGPREPRFVGSMPSVVDATYTDDGTAILDTLDGCSTVVDGKIRPLPIPERAPEPSGPIVWIA